MTDPSRHPYAGVGADHESTSGARRWGKIIGIVVAVLILLVFVVMLVGGGGEHGPSRHAPSGDDGDQAPRSIVVSEGHTSPAGGHG